MAGSWYDGEFKFKIEPIANGYLLHVYGCPIMYYRTKKLLAKDLSTMILEEKE